MRDQDYTRRVRWTSTGGPGDAVKILLLLNGIGFLAQMIWGNAVTLRLGLVPFLAWSRLEVWSFVTYAFLHGDWLHLLFNLYSLWVFGTEMEHFWGFGRFLRYYLACGIGAGVFHTLITPHSMVPTIGASGAVAGVLAAYAMTFPDRELTLLLFFVIPVQVRARFLALGYAMLSLLLGVWGSPDGIAHFAHIGGMGVGALILLLERRNFSLSAWRRRRRFRAVRREDRDRPLESEVDDVLDRAGEVGADGLSRGEKDVLIRAGRRPAGGGADRRDGRGEPPRSREAGSGPDGPKRPSDDRKRRNRPKNGS